MASEKQAEDFFIRKNISFMGLLRQPVLRAALQDDMLSNYSSEEISRLLHGWLEAGKAEQVQVEGGRDTYLVLAQDLPLLDALEKGKVPKAWKPRETTTLEEVLFLAPLDIVSARGRSKKLFDFNYIWEVYTPVHKRRWGYYVLPILYGDDLVARLDPKLDRAAMTLEIKSFWPEEDAALKDAGFANVLGQGLVRLAHFVEAKKVKTTAIRPTGLRRQVEKILRALL